MRYPPLVLAVLGLALAGEAAAAPAQGFWQGGQPVGPVYRTENPSFNPWMNWAQGRGAQCRTIGGFEANSLEKRPQVYPPEYTSERGPGYPGYDQPPPGLGGLILDHPPNKIAGAGLSVGLGYKNPPPSNRAAELEGDRAVSSRHPALRAMNLSVQLLQVEFGQ